MPTIAILSASVRTGRESDRVTKFFERFIKENKFANTDVIDLKAYNFRVFEERLSHMPEPDAQVLEFAERIKKADAVLIVTPEYNGGYPASLKNVIDLLYAEWQKKPIAIATVSNGAFGGSQVITSLVFSLWKIRAWVVPAMFPVPNVEKSYSEEGNPVDEAAVNKRATVFLKEILWCIEAKARMQSAG